ncbi:MAG TPA: ABC transporter permease [Thermoanaerobaculia bacterium]
MTGSLLRDLRQAGRVLGKNPGPTALAVATLALAIGANTTIFSVADALLSRPLPYPEPERLVLLWETTDRIERASVSLLNLRDWIEQGHAFESIGGYREVSFNLTGLDQPVRVRGQQISAGALAALGTRPLLGRLFGPPEDRPGGAPVVVVSHRLWRGLLGADPQAIGRVLKLDGEPYTVIGVVPASFRFPTAETDVWIPLWLDADQLMKNRGHRAGIFGIARLRRGVSRAQAQAAMATVARQLAMRYPETNAGFGIAVKGLHDEEVKAFRPALLVLMAAVACVLLIACVNVAALLLAHASARRREIALRAILGASRPRLVGQLLTESASLVVVAGLLGLLLALLGLHLLVAMLPGDMPGVTEIRFDGRALGFMLAVCLFTSLLAGLFPALETARPDLQQALTERGFSSGGQARMRTALVVAEVGLALILLVGAALFIRSFLNLKEVDPGFAPDNVLTARVDLPIHKYSERSQWVGFYERLLSQMSAVPGVRTAAVSSLLPLTERAPQSWVLAKGMPIPAPDKAIFTVYQAVSPGYFDAMRVPLLRGRAFDARDREETRPVAIVDETLADGFWPGRSPVGQLVAFEFGGTPAAPEPKWRQIVGVVRHVRHSHLDAEAQVELYVPLRQPPLWFQPQWPGMAVVVRSGSDPLALAAWLRHEVLAIDPDLPLHEIRSMEEIVGAELARRRLVASVLGGFATLALLLATVGLYGLISYTVSRRTNEIGVRMALGASPGKVLGMVLRQALVLSILGIAIGVPTALAMGRLASSLLYGVTAADPWIFVTAPMFLLQVAILASYVPARNATRVDPADALRRE